MYLAYKKHKKKILRQFLQLILYECILSFCGGENFILPILVF